MADKQKTDIEGIISEIRVGMVMLPYNDRDKTWNAACERAIKIAQNYQDGYGIFQIGTERSKFTTDALGNIAA